MKKISIITVVYNAVNTIERTIQSVLSQSYKNIEYIIIDGGSTDGTLEVIARYIDKIAFFVSEPDKGIYDAMNKGIKKATGMLIGLLNADDWYEPKAVEVVSKGYEYSNADIIAGETWIIQENGIRKLFGNRTFDTLWRGMCACHQSIFISKFAYNKFGLYNTKYRIASDYELLLRMYYGGASVLLLNDILSNYSATGISGRCVVELIEEVISIQQKHLVKYPEKRTEILNLNKGKLKDAKARVVIEKYSSELHCVFDMLDLLTHGGIVIWGTGTWGKRIAWVLGKLSIPINFFVDSDEKKQRRLFCGMDVQDPAVLQDYSGTVFIAVKDHDVEIAKRLSVMNTLGLSWILLRDFIDATASHYDELERKKNSFSLAVSSS